MPVKHLAQCLIKNAQQMIAIIIIRPYLRSILPTIQRRKRIRKTDTMHARDFLNSSVHSI